MAKLDNIFRDLEFEAFRAGITPRTKESIEWFRNKARQMFRGREISNRQSLMKNDLLTQQARPKTNTPLGTMYMFFYDPKYKDTLPYYDTFPLTIIMGPAKKGFYGLNLHYLPPKLRARVLDAVLGGKEIPGGLIKPMIKHYLYSHVKGQVSEVDVPEWEIATFLPTANFQKANSSKVYQDSRVKVRG